MRYTPLRHTPTRHTPTRYALMRRMPVACTPMRYTPLRCTPERFWEKPPDLPPYKRWCGASICRDLSCKIRVFALRDKGPYGPPHPSVSIEHQLKPQAMPSRLGGAYSGPTEWLCRVSRGFVSFRRVLVRARSVCPIPAQIDCFKRASVPSLEEPCSDSRGCQVLAPGESLL
jgi:hypothetical protein